MKDCCERDGETCRITVGTGSQRNLVEKFRGKFIREAQMIAGMEHPNIIRVTDVFEENGTAYYVMDYLPGGSLADNVKKYGPLTEAKAEEYIRQVADALSYIHSRNTVHLDVKPSNILLNAKGEAVLIDFGISKHYDDSGEQTSSTPVGISKGYAPLEQGRDGDVSQFKPTTDIYALGATLYYLVTGTVPPEASIVNEDGLTRPQGVSDSFWSVITGAMQPHRKNRPVDIDAFLAQLDGTNTKYVPEDDDEATTVIKPPKRPRLVWLWCLLGVLACAIVYVFFDHKGTAVESLGSIIVSSSPLGASIYLDGKDTEKTTPDTLKGVSIGVHSISLHLDGYMEFKDSVSVDEGGMSFISSELKKAVVIPLTNSHPEDSINTTQNGQVSVNSPSGSVSTVTSTSEKNDTFIRLSLNKNKVAVGEPIIATLKLFDNTNRLTGFEDVEFPKFNDFQIKEIEAPQSIEFQRELVDGEIYNTAILRRWELTPQKAGILTIDSCKMVCLVHVKIPKQQTGSSIEDFFDEYITQRKHVSTPSCNVTVTQTSPHTEATASQSGENHFSDAPQTAAP